MIIEQAPSSITQLWRAISEELKSQFKGFTIRRNARRRWLALPGETQLQLDFLIEELNIAIAVKGLCSPHQEVDQRMAELCQICGIDFFVVRDMRVLPAIVDRVRRCFDLPASNDEWRFQWTYRDVVARRLIYAYSHRLTEALERQVEEKANPFAPYIRMQECLWRHTRINPLREVDHEVAQRANQARLRAEGLLRAYYPTLHF